LQIISLILFNLEICNNKGRQKLQNKAQNSSIVARLLMFRLFYFGQLDVHFSA